MHAGRTFTLEEGMKKIQRKEPAGCVLATRGALQRERRVLRVGNNRVGVKTEDKAGKVRWPQMVKRVECHTRELGLLRLVVRDQKASSTLNPIKLK